MRKRVAPSPLAEADEPSGPAETMSRRPPMPDGAAGWNEYAAYYDWENARTLGRRDVAFWRRVALAEDARLLEFGCGTGRLLLPLARAAVDATGIDRSAPMLARARARARRLAAARRPSIVRGDIRALPFASATFGMVLAPYGMLQSLTSDPDLDAALAEARRVLRPGGLLGVDLVPDLPRWAESGPRVSLRGRARGGGEITLVEAVRQDRRRGLTIFDETFIEHRNGRAARRRTFTLTFRTLGVAETETRLAQAGFRVTDVFGDYAGGPWQDGAEAGLILARAR